MMAQINDHEFNQFDQEDSLLGRIQHHTEMFAIFLLLHMLDFF